MSDIEMNKIYWLVGSLIVMNVGTIISVLIAAGRTLWFFAKLDFQVKENTKDINAAHKHIREIRDGV